jgi:hypothetical protein
VPFIFESKAKTLENLHNNLQESKTLPIFKFSVGDYKNDKNLIGKIQALFNNIVAVRSSAKNEDSYNASNAGLFKSVLDIDVHDASVLDKAIQTVLRSYNDNNDDNEIFIQPMLENVQFAGVAFSCDISTLAPYYVINYDESGKTDAITSGNTNATKTYIHYRYYEYPCKNQNIDKVIKAIKELELLFNNKFIDVEFAVTHDDIYILQVRPIITAGKSQFRPDLTEGLFKVYKKIEKLQQPHPNLMGDKAIFGVMPDWNPAEIIGLRPKKLALSLYKELITDNIWAYQRDNYGYRNLRSHPLLISFLGIPFIDVRVDFNSFIPKSLDGKIAKKLVEYYLNKLYTTPAYHDKVEFEIVHSCFYLDLPEKLEELKMHSFSNYEIDAIKTSLLDLTNNIIILNNLSGGGGGGGLFLKKKTKKKILKKKIKNLF